jgi:hypothetical protein
VEKTPSSKSAKSRCIKDCTQRKCFRFSFKCWCVCCVVLTTK